MGARSGPCPGQLPPQGHHQQAQRHRHREVGAETPNRRRSSTTKGDSTESPLTAARELVYKRWVGTRRLGGELLFNSRPEASGGAKVTASSSFPTYGQIRRFGVSGNLRPHYRKHRQTVLGSPRRKAGRQGAQEGATAPGEDDERGRWFLGLSCRAHYHHTHHHVTGRRLQDWPVPHNPHRLLWLPASGIAEKARPSRAWGRGHSGHRPPGASGGGAEPALLPSGTACFQTRGLRRHRPVQNPRGPKTQRSSCEDPNLPS